jgi:hypothetical protein
MSTSHVLLLILAGAFLVTAGMGALLAFLARVNRGLFRVQFGTRYRMGYLRRNRLYR